MSAAVVATSSSPNNNGDDQDNNNKSPAHLSEAIANDGSPQERKDDDSKPKIMGSHEHGTSAACRPDISTNTDVSSGGVADQQQNATFISQNRAFGPSSANAAVPEKRNDLETKPSAAAFSTSSAAEKEACSLTQAHQQQPASPLPPELLGILKEVAKTGTLLVAPVELGRE